MNIFTFETKRLLKSAAVWGVINGVIITLFMLFYPSMKDLSLQALAESKLNALPEGFLEAFSLDAGIDFSDITEYLGYTAQYIAMAGCVYGAILGVNSLIREESDGTIEFLYSKPIKRKDVFIGKFASRLAVFAVYLLILWAFTVLVCLWVKPEELSALSLLSDITAMVLGIGLMGCVFLSLGMLISTLVKSAKKAVPIAISLFFLSFLTGVLGKLKEELNFLKYFSPFDYSSPSQVLSEGFTLTNVALSAIIIGVSLLVAYYVYGKKDMRI